MQEFSDPARLKVVKYIQNECLVIGGICQQVFCAGSVREVVGNLAQSSVVGVPKNPKVDVNVRVAWKGLSVAVRPGSGGGLHRPDGRYTIASGGVTGFLTSEVRKNRYPGLAATHDVDASAGHSTAIRLRAFVYPRDDLVHVCGFALRPKALHRAGGAVGVFRVIGVQRGSGVVQEEIGGRGERRGR